VRVLPKQRLLRRIHPPVDGDNRFAVCQNTKKPFPKTPNKSLAHRVRFHRVGGRDATRSRGISLDERKERDLGCQNG